MSVKSSSPICLVALIVIICVWVALWPMMGEIAENFASVLLVVICATFFLAILAGMLASLPKRISRHFLSIPGLLIFVAVLIFTIITSLGPFPSQETPEEHDRSDSLQDSGYVDRESFQKLLHDRGEAAIKEFHMDEWSKWKIASVNETLGKDEHPRNHMQMLKLQTELEELKMAALREKAVAAGVPRDELESAEERGKTALISVIMARERFKLLTAR